MTNRFGLLGEHLGHSFSPQIHTVLGCPDYGLYEVEPDKLAEFLETTPLLGMNVTIPYKKAVVPLCAALSPAAERIGSVNTLRRTSEGWGTRRLFHSRGYLIPVYQRLALCPAPAGRGERTDSHRQAGIRGISENDETGTVYVWPGVVRGTGGGGLAARIRPLLPFPRPGGGGRRLVQRVLLAGSGCAEQREDPDLRPGSGFRPGGQDVCGADPTYPIGRRGDRRGEYSMPAFCIMGM